MQKENKYNKRLTVEMHLLRINQMNVGKNQIEMNELLKMSHERETEVICIQEPYTVNKTAFSHFKEYNLISISKEDRSKAAMAIKPNLRYLIDTELSDDNHLIVIVNNMVIVSSYFNLKEKNEMNLMKADRNIQKDLNVIEKLTNKYSNKPIIICMDSNSRNKQWGDKIDCNRGIELNIAAHEQQLIILNDPNSKPTFTMWATEQNASEQALRTSHIDLTIVNELAFKLGCNWKLSEEEFNTNHKLIEIEVQINSRIQYTFSNQRSINYKRTDWKKFQSTFNRLKPDLDRETDLDSLIQKFDRQLKKACDDEIKYSTKQVCNEKPWLTRKLIEEYVSLMRVRRKVNVIKKAATNSKQQQFNKLNVQLKEMTKQYQANEKEAIISHSHEMHQITTESELWKEWRSANKKKYAQPIILNGNKDGSIAENHQILREQFIKRTNKPYCPINIQCDRKLEPTTTEELDKIINSLNEKKAAGPDEISNKLYKILYTNNKNYFTQLFNKCLSAGKLPKSWRTGKLIYFDKPGKTGREATDYRPITLLNAFTKTAETLMIRRIEKHLNQIEFFSDLQFGFRTGLSTVDAIRQLTNSAKNLRMKYKYCVMVCLDISGAFDGINWAKIVQNTSEANADPTIVMAVQSLLCGRKVLFENETYSSTRGCPQGGKASPALWKIGLNDLLRKIEKLQNTKVIAFADDLAALLCSDNKRELQIRVNELFKMVKIWCEEAELELNLGKTDWINFSRTRDEIKLTVNEKQVQFKEAVKYLGVMIDGKLLWRSHLNYLNKKITKLIETIRRLMWLSEDVKLEKKLKIYNAVVLPSLMYASEVWYEDIKSKTTYLDQLNQIQRKVLVTITRTYNSTNTQKLLNLINLCSLSEELLIKQNAINLSKEARPEFKKTNRTMYIKEKPTFHFPLDITQSRTKSIFYIITNKGPFRQFLKNIKKVDNEFCRYCRCVPETAIHLLIECEWFDDARETCDFNKITDFERLTNFIIKKLYIDTNR